MNDNMPSVVEIVGTVIFIICLLLGLLGGIRLSEIGEGEHSGYITSVDQRGYIFKNYDVYFKTDNSSSQEDTYCIDRRNTDLIAKAKEVNKNRKQVVIVYQGVRGIGLGLCHGSQIKDIQIK